MHQKIVYYNYVSLYYYDDRLTDGQAHNLGSILNTSSGCLQGHGLFVISQLTL